jgi:hypothetical protein
MLIKSSETYRGGAETVSSVWQAPSTQECDQQGPEGAFIHSPSHCKLSVPTSITFQDRKFFDSGDYAMSKAGKAPQNSVGTAIPNPEK